jgi:hypothetical protein
MSGQQFLLELLGLGQPSGALEYGETAASGSPWLVSSFRFSCPFRFLHTFLSSPAGEAFPRFRIRRSSFERRGTMGRGKHVGLC